MSYKPTVSLCMIVKNENSPHLVECFESVKEHIDHWVICDTGSTDGTQQFIRDYFEKAGIPGELHEIEWQGFGKARTHALKMCDGKADYAWMIDADDRLVGKFDIPHNTVMDAFQLRIQRGNFSWWRNQIFKTGIGWEYVGVLHEYAHCPGREGVKQGRIATPGYYVDARTLGARNQDDDKNPIDFKVKYLRDAEVLVDALTNPENPNYEPENHRYHFYAGQSFFDAQDFENAKIWYQKRAELGGWDEEIFYSLYRVAMCASIMGEPFAEVIQYFLRAWESRPFRPEPLHQISRLYRLNGHPKLAYLFAKHAASLPRQTNDILFIPDHMYAWQLDDEVGSTAFYANAFGEGYDACRKLLAENKYPESEGQRIRDNLRQYELAIQKVSDDMAQRQRRHEEMMNQLKQAEEEQKQKRIDTQRKILEEKNKRKRARKNSLKKQAKKAHR